MNTFVEGKLYLGFAHTVPMKIYGSNEKSAVSETKKDNLCFVCTLVLLTRTFGEPCKCLTLIFHIKGDKLW